MWGIMKESRILWRKPAFLWSALGVLFLSGVVLFVYEYPRALRRAFTIGEHEYDMVGRMRFLEEAVALEMAYRALRDQRFDTNQWKPITRAPNGSRDTYLSRNVQNPNHATITFRNESELRTVYVSVAVQNGKIRCTITRPF